MAKLTSAIVEKVLRVTHGNIAAAAKKLGVTRRAIEYRVETTPGLADVVKDAREAIVDEAEAALGRAVKNGEPWAVTLTLKTQGKVRGYVERQEVTGKDGGALAVIERLVDGDGTAAHGATGEPAATNYANGNGRTRTH